MSFSRFNTKKGEGRMEFLFTQFEVESKASKILDHGDETDMANRTGKSAGIYSQMFNPHDERESNFHKVLKEIVAVIDIDRDRGIRLYCLFKSFIERHVQSEEFLNTMEELEKTDKEMSDVWKCRLRGKTPGEQLEEIEQAEQQLGKLKRAVANEVRSLEQADFMPRHNYAPVN
jgi:hypothetical protein